MLSKKFNIKISKYFSLNKDLCLRSTSYINKENNKYDVAVIGGGIIGTSIARELKNRQKELKVCLVDKEGSLGQHQTSHNSGVMHCGIYYKPNSLKASFCTEGLSLLKEYCDKKEIKYKRTGKMIVAKNSSEVKILHTLLEQGHCNKVKGLQLLESQCDIRKYAHGCRGIQALWCPETSNVNYKEVTEHLAKDFELVGGKIFLNFCVEDISESSSCQYPVYIKSRDNYSLCSKYAICCGGLQSESLSRLIDSNGENDRKFVSLKADYLQIDSKYCENLQTNIYPVPDLELPFLGSHLSPKLDNYILLGPYAVPALKVEGYCNDEINLNYLKTILLSCNFRNMVIRNFSKCMNQASQALCFDLQIKSFQELIPNISYQFVEKGQTSAQCQLLNHDGTFVDDFVFDFFQGEGLNKRIINLKFTPSPAATSCLAIAKHISDRFYDECRLKS